MHVLFYLLLNQIRNSVVVVTDIHTPNTQFKINIVVAVAVVVVATLRFCE